MQKNHTRGILAVGIIILFIGVGIHPAFAVDTKHSMVNKASEKDCGCNEVSDADLIIVERLLDKVEVYSKLLLVLSRHNPELKEISEELSKEISTLKDKLAEQQFLIICSILYGIAIIIVEIADVLIKWRDSTEEGTLEHQIAEFFYEIYWQTTKPIRDIIFVIGFIFGCWYVPTLNLIINKRNYVPFRI